MRAWNARHGEERLWAKGLSPTVRAKAEPREYVRQFRRRAVVHLPLHQETTLNRLITVAAAALMLSASVVWARSVITTLAGCKSEFGHGGASKSCEACVKSKGRYTQHAAKKGVWVCE